MIICILCPATHIGVGNHQKPRAKETALKRKIVWKEGQNSECPLFVILEDKKKKRRRGFIPPSQSPAYDQRLIPPCRFYFYWILKDSAKPPHHKRGKMIAQLPVEERSSYWKNSPQHQCHIPKTTFNKFDYDYVSVPYASWYAET